MWQRICKCNHAESKKNKTNWEDVFKHYKKLYGKCIPATLADFASECVHYNVNICRGEKGHFCFFKWVDCGVVSIGQALGPNGYLTMNLKQSDC